jgi:hypothetical protein
MLARLGLAAVLFGMAVSLSGCVFFSNAFWSCLASDWTDADACLATAEYLDQEPGDLDSDGFTDGADPCPLLAGPVPAQGCPDRDGDGVPDAADDCPSQLGPGPSGCPPTSGGEPPAKPTGLTAIGLGSRIHLDWDDNAEADLAGYTIERATASGGPYTPLADVPGTTSQYDDGSVEGPIQTYYYVVSAYDVGGNAGARSDEVAARACPPAECPTRKHGGGAALTAARAYRARVTGRALRVGSLGVKDGVLRGRAAVFAGRLVAVAGAPAGLRRARWRARLGFAFPLTRQRGTARGTAVASFGSRGKLCLRFTQVIRLAGDGARVLSGRFRAIGASGRARALAAASRFTGTPRARGGWTLRASGRGGRPVRARLPKACRGI